MTELHPITPSPELVQKWQREANHNEPMFPQVAAIAAQWGSDRELQLCLEWFQEFYKGETWMHKDLKIFMAARRPAPPCPKPPSLKEQALEALKHAEEGWRPVPADCEIIRRALEQLDD